mmetsp:Transcript_131330/g.245750  ORF Transcript_131330/g.245750 Transcript_131330/m.245750 type:complete len:211 (+) Transcript_131330:115-747(+)
MTRRESRCLPRPAANCLWKLISSCCGREPASAPAPRAAARKFSTPRPDQLWLPGAGHLSAPQECPPFLSELPPVLLMQLVPPARLARSVLVPLALLIVPALDAPPACWCQPCLPSHLPLPLLTPLALRPLALPTLQVLPAPPAHWSQPQRFHHGHCHPPSYTMYSFRSSALLPHHQTLACYQPPQPHPMSLHLPAELLWQPVPLHLCSCP